MKIIDAHTHIRFSHEGSPHLYKLMARNGVDMVNTLSAQCGGNLSQNAMGALNKLRHPKTAYAFGGLDYATGKDFLSQVQTLYDTGFDGMKMLEGKPTIRKKLGIALDDAKYEPFYSFLEEKRFPVLMHIADPPSFWDKGQIPSWALEQGWFYDESFVPYNQFYLEINNVLKKHPDLPVILAHFYFLSQDIEKAGELLDNHPSVCIDITAGIEMYENFSKDPAMWREFFIKHSHRIIYGTDYTDDPPEEDDSLIALNAHGKMEIEFIQSEKAFTHYNMTIRGLGLPENVQENIFYNNFTRLAGETPKPVDAEMAVKNAEYTLGFIKDGDQRGVMGEVIKQMKKV